MKQKFLLGKTKYIALVALMAALLEGGKLALSALPNVEVVTLLCALYGYVFGLYGIFAIYIFIGAEVFVWGAGTWILSYCIHFPLVCIVFFCLKKLRVRNRFFLTAVATVMTVAFGVLTSLVDVGLFTTSKINFWSRFSILYVRGIIFYIVHTVCNLILFLFVFPVLATVLQKLKSKYFERTVG